MELQDYCRNVQIELAGWQAKVKEVVRRLDEEAWKHAVGGNVGG
ncbi:MAG: hypothetical protein P8X67_09010 [Syntrophobacterales bacterium]